MFEAVPEGLISVLLGEACTLPEFAESLLLPLEGVNSRTVGLSLDFGVAVVLLSMLAKININQHKFEVLMASTYQVKKPEHASCVQKTHLLLQSPSQYLELWVCFGDVWLSAKPLLYLDTNPQTQGEQQCRELFLLNSWHKSHR